MNCRLKCDDCASMRFRITTMFWVLVVVATGCGGPRGVTGGTQGVLRSGDVRLAEIQLTIHQLSGSTYVPLGFGTTRSDGTFELVTNGAKGPLRLNAGQYKCTMESIGSPLTIPVQYRTPFESTLTLTWKPEQRLIDLDVPGLSH